MASCGFEKQTSGMAVARFDARNILFIFKQLRDNLRFEPAEDRGTLVRKAWLDRFAGNNLNSYTRKGRMARRQLEHKTASQENQVQHPWRLSASLEICRDPKIRLELS